MKYRSRSTQRRLNRLGLYFWTTPYSTRLLVSRNGIPVEQVANISINYPLLLVGVNYNRLVFWLSKKLPIHGFSLSAFNPTLKNFFYPNVKPKKTE